MKGASKVIGDGGYWALELVEYSVDRVSRGNCHEGIDGRVADCLEPTRIITVLGAILVSGQSGVTS